MRQAGHSDGQHLARSPGGHVEGVGPGNQNTQVHTLVLPPAPCVALAQSVHSLGISFLICRKAVITTHMPLGSIEGGNKGQGADLSC